jgi:hypothetical protein
VDLAVREARGLGLERAVLMHGLREDTTGVERGPALIMDVQVERPLARAVPVPRQMAAAQVAHREPTGQELTGLGPAELNLAELTRRTLLVTRTALVTVAMPAVVGTAVADTAVAAKRKRNRSIRWNI